MTETIETMNPECDRTGWAAGQWDSEPDNIQWEHEGVACLIVRNPMMGHLCGYVGVPLDSEWSGMSYDEDNALVQDLSEAAHAGLTYANTSGGLIRHEGGEEMYWFGFDCAHAYDSSPGADAMMSEAFKARHAGSIASDSYRDVPYVREICNTMACLVMGHMA